LCVKLATETTTRQEKEGEKEGVADDSMFVCERETNSFFNKYPKTETRIEVEERHEDEAKTAFYITTSKKKKRKGTSERDSLRMYRSQLTTNNLCWS